jgi:hypothetical protein
MQEVGFEAKLYGDGGVIGRTGTDAVIIGPGHRVEGAGVMGESDSQPVLWRTSPPLSYPEKDALMSGHARLLSVAKRHADDSVGWHFGTR